jgi:hypothetical protein
MESVMPKFAISWKKIHYSEWGNPPEHQTGSGMEIVEASSLSAVQEEVKKYAHKECSMDERVYINDIAEYKGKGKALSLEIIRNLMDPWGCLRKP